MTVLRYRVIRRRAIRIDQDPRHPLFLFALRPDELLALADISRVARSASGDLIGYQRPEVRKHVQNIIEYLDSQRGGVLFPNSLILALSSSTRFKEVRGPKVEDDGVGEAGTIAIRVPLPGEPKPAWIVDGQQRALALSRCRNRSVAIPVSAFIADDLETQREQFLRVNSTKPLPRGLITELLPEVSTVLPATLAARRVPAALCEFLNRDPASPFFGLIKRSSETGAAKKKALVPDTVLVQILHDSFASPTGCLFAYRNIATGETDFERVQRLLCAFWHGVKDTFPEAWGRAPSESRLMHSVGLRAMGRVMDRVMGNLNVDDKQLPTVVRRELTPLKPECAWTAGTWDALGGIKWNGLQNVPLHLRLLTNHLLRVQLRAGSTS